MSEAKLLGLAGVVMALVEGLKKIGLPSKFALLAAIIISEVFIFGLSYSPALIVNLLLGLGVALASAGGYDGLKQLIGAFISKTTE